MFQVEWYHWFRVVVFVAFCQNLVALFLLIRVLYRYASQPTIVRYAKIAMKMKDKTVRDVALRCRWMTVCFCEFFS